MDFRIDIIIEDGKVFWSVILPLSAEQARTLFGDSPPALDHKSALVPVLPTPTGDVYVQVTRVL